jgi:hypothetical protein
LQHLPLASLDICGRSKLAAKFFRTFQIIEHVGEVSYKVKLPKSMLALIKRLFNVPTCQVNV